MLRSRKPRNRRKPKHHQRPAMRVWGPNRGPNLKTGGNALAFNKSDRRGWNSNPIRTQDTLERTKAHDTPLLFTARWLSRLVNIRAGTRRTASHGSLAMRRESHLQSTYSSNCRRYEDPLPQLRFLHAIRVPLKARIESRIHDYRLARFPRKALGQIESGFFSDGSAGADGFVLRGGFPLPV